MLRCLEKLWLALLVDMDVEGGSIKTNSGILFILKIVEHVYDEAIYPI